MSSVHLCITAALSEQEQQRVQVLQEDHLIIRIVYSST